MTRLFLLPRVVRKEQKGFPHIGLEFRRLLQGFFFTFYGLTLDLMDTTRGVEQVKMFTYSFLRGSPR